MQSKPLSITTCNIVSYLYLQNMPCKRKDIVDAVEDTPKHVANSLRTLMRLEIVKQVMRGYYILQPHIQFNSELDYAMLGLKNRNLRKGLLSLSNIYIYNYRDTIILSPSSNIYSHTLSLTLGDTPSDTVKGIVDGNSKGDSAGYIPTPYRQSSPIEDVYTLPIAAIDNCNVGGVGGKNNPFSSTEITGQVDEMALVLDLCGSSTLREDGEVKGKCPLHSEQTPSFYYNLNNSAFVCFGCGLKGRGIFTLLEKLGYEGEELLDFAYTYAVEGMQGERVERREDNGLLHAQEKHREYEHEIVQIRAWAEHGYAGFESDWLHGQETPEALYMFNRGILPDALMHFGVSVLKHVRDYRLYFPLALNGVVYGYQRRTLRSGKYVPKYLTMAGMDKTEHVYGEISVSDGQETVLLCEGVTDMLVAWQRGLKNVSTSLGASVSDAQASELASLGVKRVIHAAHPDSAGDSAYLMAKQLLVSYGIESQRLVLTTDIADSTCADFLQAYRDAETSFSQFSEIG